MKDKKEETIPYLPFAQSNFGPMRMNFFDPMGSYSGYPVNPMEKPVQDADDL